MRQMRAAHSLVVLACFPICVSATTHGVRLPDGTDNSASTPYPSPVTNTYYGTEDDDEVFGGNGGQAVFKGAGGDVTNNIFGLGGADTIEGGSADTNDWSTTGGVRHGTTTNNLNGGDGADRLYGGGHSGPTFGKVANRMDGETRRAPRRRAACGASVHACHSCFALSRDLPPCAAVRLSLQAAPVMTRSRVL